MFKTVKDNLEYIEYIEYLTYIKEVLDSNNPVHDFNSKYYVEYMYTINLRNAIASNYNDITIPINHKFLVTCLDVDIDTIEVFNRKRKIENLI